MSAVVEFFAPYEGDKPYIFVSYSHRDTARVLPIIRSLRDRSLRIWYDEGIPAGSDWPRAIADHLRSSAAMLLFLSPTTMDSPNCASEASTAADLGKPLVVAPLDGCEPAGEWKRMLEGATWVEPSANAIAGAEVLDGRFVGSEGDYARTARRRVRRSPWVFAQWISAALLVASVALFAALATGAISLGERPAEASPRETVVEEPAPAVQTVDLSAYGDIFVDAVTFPDAQQERALRAVLDEPTGIIGRERLLNVDALVFAGSMTPAGPEGISFSPDGACTLNGIPVVEGRVSDLSLIADMPYLERLFLVHQPLGALDGLAGHQVLVELSLAGSTVDDLSALADLPSLSVLHLEHTAVSDLSPLDRLPAITRVTVSADMLPLDLPEDAGFYLVLAR